MQLFSHHWRAPRMLSAVVVTAIVCLAGIQGQEIAAAKESASQVEGRLIQIRLPLTGNADQHYKMAIDRAVDALTSSRSHSGRRPVLILELSPAPRSGDYGIGSDYERAQSLARYLSSEHKLSAVKIVAYIPRSIKGHGVLVAMACEEIVMNPVAEFGAAGADEEGSRPVEPVHVSLYQQIAQARRTLPEAIALGMLDNRLVVHKVETEVATEFLLADEVEQAGRESTIISDEILIPAGSLGLFTGSEGRQYGFVKYLAKDREALTRVLKLPPDAVVEDQSLLSDWRPVIIDVEGPITSRKIQQYKTLIATEKDQRDINWIGLRIDSIGGDLQACLNLAEVLVNQDATEVRTVAYVPVQASEGAAIIGLACDQVVLHPAAKLGGPGFFAADEAELDEAAITVLKSFAELSGQSWSLLVAFLDPNMELFSYSNSMTGEVRSLGRGEAEDLIDAENWRRGAAITTPNEPLTLNSVRAMELGLAWQVVANFDEFKQLYGFNEEPRIAKPNMALELVAALSNPALAAMLLFIGFIGIYLELHSPGFGVGGFIAAVAFMLFFWSKFLGGTANWLEILLFACGMFFVLLEIFVLPGFGVFGLGGAVMVIVSLVLVSQTFILPNSQSELEELRNSMAVLVAAGTGVILLAIGLRRWLPNAPVLRTLLLNPLAGEELEDLEYRENVADYSYLVGQHGTTVTDLLPAGKANINGTMIDVIADGELIDRGQTVEVVTSRGNRVVVRAVDV